MRNHSEERLEKIKELGNELIEYECMADSVSADVKAVTDRWDTLQHQVSICVECEKIDSLLSLFMLHVKYRFAQAIHVQLVVLHVLSVHMNKYNFIVYFECACFVYYIERKTILHFVCLM